MSGEPFAGMPPEGVDLTGATTDVALSWSDWHARQREARVVAAMAAGEVGQPWESRWVSGWREARP